MQQKKGKDQREQALTDYAVFTKDEIARTRHFQIAYIS